MYFIWDTDSLGQATEKLIQKVLNFIHMVLNKREVEGSFLAETVYLLKKVDNWCFFSVPVGLDCNDNSFYVEINNFS